MMRELRKRLPGRDDSGVTLIEVMVTTTVMMIVMAIVTTSILDIYRSVNEIDAEAEAQTQITSAFLRLDREIRYARSISDPALVDGSWHVEYVVNLKEVDTCVELRLNTVSRELQRRQWEQNLTPLAPTAWTTLGSHMESAKPFNVTAPDASPLTGFRYQRLNLKLTATVGKNASASQRVTDVTFTALNATAISNNATTCIEARGVTS
ncbi:prepilin-type N-terminal cleavage/methylation domain-containing protein [Actinoplanes sp. GCM10030250]|uniref:PilW family protein n=1 Tax=Actinoplanes sp. GCM10030250 TaxID=3273376 RepID=UPI00361E8B48